MHTPTNEDSCPGDTICTQYAGSGSTKKPYCLKALGGGKAASSSWFSAKDVNTPGVLAHKLSIASAFTVVALRHSLGMLGKYCDSGLAHRVDLIVTTKAELDQSPTVKETFAVAQSTASIYPRILVHYPTSPVSLAKGDSAFFVVELTSDATTGKQLCLMSNSTAPATTVFRAHTTKAPYKWEKVSSSPPQVSLLGF